MEPQEIKNYMPMQSLQVGQLLPAQKQSVGYPIQNPISQQQPPVNYIPRYAPYVSQGQVYSVPIPQEPTPTVQSGQNAQGGQKAGSVGTVNITINGVNPPGQQYTGGMPQYVPYPYYVPYQTAQVPASVQSALPTGAEREPLAATKIEDKKTEETPQPQKKEDKQAKKDVLPLTDQYLKDLETDLNNPSKEVRASAVAELIKRFKEDESRKNDPALTNLLNLALQDPAKTIVYGAMVTILNGYANGNEKTIQLLENIKAQKDKFGNSDTADAAITRIRLSQQQNQQIQPSQASPIKEPPGQKLNLISE